MEKRPDNPPQRRIPSHVFLDPEIVKVHLQANEPIDKERALIIYMMNKHIDEFDPEKGPGIARPGW